ncbi:MAG: cell division protein FtsQ/DivIB, partial [Burkholderiales bacterium]
MDDSKPGTRNPEPGAGAIRWDRTLLMNGLASALYAVAVVIALYGAWTLAARLPVFALREVRVGGELAHVTRGEIEAVVQRELKGNFLTLDLAAVSASFQRLPWVRKANARRLWPARIDVALEEHVPLARWGGAALVNTQGEVFQAAYDGKLPVFIGPDGMAREIAIQFRYFRGSLETIGE